MDKVGFRVCMCVCLFVRLLVCEPTLQLIKIEYVSVGVKCGMNSIKTDDKPQLVSYTNRTSTKNYVHTHGVQCFFYTHCSSNLPFRYANNSSLESAV